MGFIFGAPVPAAKEKGRRDLATAFPDP